MRLGIDVGSTTVKLVLLDENDKIIYSNYERHMSNVFDKVEELLEKMFNEVGDIGLEPIITGSGGLSLADILKIKFEQEVIACSLAVEQLIPETDVVIELGGEDAKITFYGATVEQRMNGTCAGGTGAFIDQMAVLLNTDASGLNEASKNHKMIYPIAARCGVFAKTDIQPLINEGAAIEDLSVSIFQAVVNQTISGLACGRPIRGNVAFLGGPLTYLSELRNRFIKTLNLEPDQVVFPENSKYFVALGAAYKGEEVETIQLSKLINRIKNVEQSKLNNAKYMEPLFKDEEEYRKFEERHSKAKVERADIAKVKGKVFLGIDAGSTTTKAVLIDDKKRLLFTDYRNNEGNPIGIVKTILRELYAVLPEDAYIANSTVTGYGEGLIKAGFKVDLGEIETLAHYKAAASFLPDVDFILDIGGQDMKCMRIKDGAIYNIMLNESCSSGCGSFIETYAKSVNLETPEFAQKALFAKHPVDLGTRCTVFVNSKVKQAQKEGATIGEISAGLSCSVIKNALYKVIKLRNPEDAGNKIVVQGGTFLNPAVLRSMERILDKEVIRPDIAGNMGAYGAAVIAKEAYNEGTKSTILTLDELDSFTVENSNGRCNGCENKCIITINKFSDNSKYITGNRCEIGAGRGKTTTDVPNLYQYKFNRLFGYQSLNDQDAKRGSVGIPRVLNMYENYPFWHTFFTTLGYKVVLSPASSKSLYEKGIETISSDTACYPAKLVHGHIQWLVEHGQKWIFYPCINYEMNEDKEAPNHYNCPIVATYPEVIANNMDEIFKEKQVKFSHPFLPYDNDERLIAQMVGFFENERIPKREIRKAVKAARQEYLAFKTDVAIEAKRALDYGKRHHKKAIILSGRPYHLDPEVNHGIDQLINSYDMIVLTEDSVSADVKLDRPIRVLDQWMYHSRLYKAAIFAGANNDVELIQLNSFGCGVDAVTTDESEELLSKNNKLYTVLKIDEGSNLGAAKIRVRSLKAAMNERERNGIMSTPDNTHYGRVEFTKEMKKSYTVLVPQLSPIHFQFFQPIFKSLGYKVVVLPSVSKNAVEEGLKYVNNDACYPTILTVGQIIVALKSGKYDLDKTAVFMSQTGGGCRASNYVAIIRKALKDLGMAQIPVVSFNAAGIEKNSGFKITAKMGFKLLIAALYGDTLMKCLYQTRPYELVSGSANKLEEKWKKSIIDNIVSFNLKTYKKNIQAIVNDFDKLPLKNVKKPRVGVVGEILVKYHPNANNDIVGLIEAEGGEAVVPDFVDFFMYGMYSKRFNYQNLAGSRKEMYTNHMALNVIEYFRKPIRKAYRLSKRFTEGKRIEDIADGASQILSIGNQCGEGWLLTGEMVDLLEEGVNNIVCMQPFACLPNHVTGKGMIKSLRNQHPKANIVAIDFDPGASTVNQFNRIKLMMSTAFKNM